MRDERNAVHRLRAAEQFARRVRRVALHGDLDFFFQRFLMREQQLDFLFQFVQRRIDFAGNALDELQLLVRQIISRQARDSFNSPDARRNRAFADDAEQTNLARRARVRAAAKLHGITVQLPCPSANLDDAHRVAVFVAEELHHVLAMLHVGVRDFCPRDAGVFEDALVDELLDVGDLLRA